MNAFIRKKHLVVIIENPNCTGSHNYWTYQRNGDSAVPRLADGVAHFKPSGYPTFLHLSALLCSVWWPLPQVDSPQTHWWLQAIYALLSLLSGRNTLYQRPPVEFVSCFITGKGNGGIRMCLDLRFSAGVLKQWGGHAFSMVMMIQGGLWPLARGDVQARGGEWPAVRATSPCLWAAWFLNISLNIPHRGKNCSNLSELKPNLSYL